MYNFTLPHTHTHIYIYPTNHEWNPYNYISSTSKNIHQSSKSYRYFCNRHTSPLTSQILNLPSDFVCTYLHEKVFLFHWYYIQCYTHPTNYESCISRNIPINVEQHACSSLPDTPPLNNQILNRPPDFVCTYFQVDVFLFHWYYIHLYHTNYEWKP